MTPLLDALLNITGLFVFSWILIFGGMGALLAHVRGQSEVTGLTLGLLGPLGWLLIWSRWGPPRSNLGLGGGAAGETFSEDWNEI